MFAEKLQFFYVLLPYPCQLKDKLNFSKSTQENQSTIFFIQFVYGNPSFLLSQEKKNIFSHIYEKQPLLVAAILSSKTHFIFQPPTVGVE